ncbi:MAG: hypothetical protein ABFD06_02455 [Smithella sp.]|jgi:hypothetical protein
MNVEHLKIDSEILGRSVLSISEFSRDKDFISFEKHYRDQYDPVYVSCKIPMEDIGAIHVLESYGFSLIEFQIRSTINLRKKYDVSKYHYKFELVKTEDELKDVLAIARDTFVHDRFSIDPLINKQISGERYAGYVHKSFYDENESVYRLFEPKDKRTLAFKTHRYIGNNEVLFLLGGVHPDFKNLGLGPINGFYEMNTLISKGIKKGYTNISAVNYPVFNLEIGRLGFRVIAVFAVLRKIYHEHVKKSTRQYT